MAEFITYKPTEKLTTRNRNTYYGAIKDWVLNMPVFEKWFDVTCDDNNYTITCIPKDENLVVFKLVLMITTSGTSLYGYTSSTGSITASFSYFTGDAPFYVYDGDDTFSIGLSTVKPLYTITTVKSFTDESARKVVLIGYQQVYECVSGDTYLNSVGSAFNKVCTGITDVYRIQSLPISNTDFICTRVYYFDGGMSNPPSGVFKVGNNTYCTLVLNIVLKLS